MSIPLTPKRKRLLILTASVLVACVLVVLVWRVRLEARMVLTNPIATPLFEDRQGHFLAEAERDTLGFWKADDYRDSRVARALLAVEDKRFYSHGGVDGRGLARAMRNNLTGGPRQGASTIAMQVARLQNQQRRSYLAKLEEMVVARALVRRFGHDAVLAHYLRIVPQGNRMHGVVYGARRYLRKPLEDLSWAEAAVLAALPKAPGRYNLYKDKGRKAAVVRAHMILKLLHQQNHLDDGELAREQKLLDGLRFPEKEIRPFNSYHAVLRLLDDVPQQPTVERPIRTTLDLTIQDQVEIAARGLMQRLRPKGAGNIAVMVVDRNSGGIRAYLGSEDYSDDLNAGAIDYAATPRSSGSTLKPFFFALGLERGDFHPDTVLGDLPLNLTYPGGHYAVRNFDDAFQGPMLYRRALANSRNVPSVSVLQKISLTRGFDHLKELGLVDNSHSADFYGLGLAIGGAYVTLEDLVAAYGVLANEGKPFHLTWTSQQPEQVGKAKRIYREDTARLISLFLSDPRARLPAFPSSAGLSTPFPVAIKTGTSQGFRDAWAVGYSHQYIIGAWVGHPDNEKMRRVPGSHVADMVTDLFVQLQPEAARGIDTKPFPAPRDHRAVKLCPLSGQEATTDCDAPVLEYVAADYPLRANTLHRQYLTNPNHHHHGEPQVITGYAFPLKYRAWAAARGYPAPPDQPEAEIRLEIKSPINGARLQLDPEMPPGHQTLSLSAAVAPTVPEIVWYINGLPYKRTAPPYRLRWPMQPGTHQIQARFPNAAVASEIITVDIKP